jgi:hypothetical protein
MSTLKCGCVIATRMNTESVRKDYEVGGYVKKWCPKHDDRWRKNEAKSGQNLYTS